MDPTGFIAQVRATVTRMIAAERDEAVTTGKPLDVHRGTNEIAVPESTSPVVDRQVRHTFEAEDILELVEANGGRMRQTSIVSVTEVSKSTVSRRLQELESEGEISRHRLGKGKVVCLPGHEPPTVDTSFGAEKATAEE